MGGYKGIRKLDNLDLNNNGIKEFSNHEEMNHFVGASEAFALSEGLTNASTHNNIQTRSE